MNTPEPTLPAPSERHLKCAKEIHEALTPGCYVTSRFDYEMVEIIARHFPDAPRSPAPAGADESYWATVNAKGKLRRDTEIVLGKMVSHVLANEEVSALRAQLDAKTHEADAYKDQLADMHADFSANTDLAALRQQLREARNFIEKVSKQKTSKPDYWTPCGQCDDNIEAAKELLADRTQPEQPDKMS